MAVDVCRAHLRDHGLWQDQQQEGESSDSKGKRPAAEAHAFDLPRLQGPTIAHHFRALGMQASEPYLSLAHDLASKPLPPCPEREHFALVPGWTHYHADDNAASFEQVEYPPYADTKGDSLVFDVETLPCQGGHFPVMAVAASPDHAGWFVWLSPWLTGDSQSPNHLIPLGPQSRERSPRTPSLSTRSNADSRPLSLFEGDEETPRLVVGHNVLFDRSRVASEYALQRPSTRWLDTMSLHIAVSGLTNPQRVGWLSYKKQNGAAGEAAAVLEDDDAEEVAAASVRKGHKAPPPEAKAKAKTWQEVSSMNSLEDVVRLHCGRDLDKSTREVFIDPDTTIEVVRAQFADLVAYCASDVLATHDAFRALLPRFRKQCPHPVSFAGVLLMSQPVLPVDHNWPQYLERAERVYELQAEGVNQALRTLAEEARQKFGERDEAGRCVWENDIWLRQLDWSPKKARRLPAAQRAAIVAAPTPVPSTATSAASRPRWFAELENSESDEPLVDAASPLAALLLRTTWRGRPVVHSSKHGWLFAVPDSENDFEPGSPKERAVPAAQLEGSLQAAFPDATLYTVPGRGNNKCRTLLGSSQRKAASSGLLASAYKETGVAFEAMPADRDVEQLGSLLSSLAQEALAQGPESDMWLRQLSWDAVVPEALPLESATCEDVAQLAEHDLAWPLWYHDLTDRDSGALIISINKRAAPLLLKLRWKGYPLVYSREHGWMYRVPELEAAAMMDDNRSLKAATFRDGADETLRGDRDHIYFRLPHPDGEAKNVGNPLSKPFVKAFDEGILTSEYPVAKEALALNASCSYWSSARERILNQMVVWGQDAAQTAPSPDAVAEDPSAAEIRGLILPQVVTMGTITRRAVEKTWLTASNAKKNRVGSELKSMIRAPPGYAIVGADVDSEELWICSVMGDAQFGVHGGTAIGWMTLEGTKSAGTDLHSKSASILGISRDDAKVFNYSRIYGAGVKHAVQLLLKSNPSLDPDRAQSLAKALYASTKGLTYRGSAFTKKFWHGGSESFVFNKLEEIAQSEEPKTPALGCGVTAALTRAHLPANERNKAGEAFLPSRINWAVQSSGVDYLHLLVVSMEYLTQRFDIDARYMISVHDELRYLVKEEDKYRAALALQISNLWVRSMFARQLEMDDLPQVRLDCDCL